MPRILSDVKKILLISLSNIGDVILTFPVLDVLRNDFPDAQVSVVAGPKGAPLLKENPAVAELFVYNKRQSVPETLRWLGKLRRERFDLIVDLRHTAIPVFVPSRFHTPLFRKSTAGQHMRRQHLQRLGSVYAFPERERTRAGLWITDADRRQVDGRLGIGGKFVVVAPGAADSKKRWHEDGFAHVCRTLVTTHQVTIVLVGDANDVPVTERIAQRIALPVVNLAGKISLPQLGYLLSRAGLAIVNDSAPMHLASYVNVPVIALFGPTDPEKYGPWSSRCRVIRKSSRCPGCQGHSRNAAHDCMQAISAEDVVNSFTLTETGVVWNEKTGELIS